VRPRPRRIALLLVVASALAGCAAGRWIAGAPVAGGAPAATLLANRCASCHAVPDPHAMSADAWLASLERMKRRMHLPDAEWDHLAALAKH
jgi:hypothetical protein